MSSIDTITCYDCKIAKPSTEFFPSFLKRNLRWCKTCRQKWVVAYNKLPHVKERTYIPAIRLKIRARNGFHWRLRTGQIIRPDHCQNCGLICKPQAHHHKGYKGANRFEVQWVCRPCHDYIHRLNTSNLADGT